MRHSTNHPASSICHSRTRIEELPSNCPAPFVTPTGQSIIDICDKRHTGMSKYLVDDHYMMVTANLTLNLDLILFGKTAH